MKRLAVLTSGGDSPGMNPAIRAVVRTSIYKGHKIFGIQRGYQGLMEGAVDEMKLSSVGDIIHRGGTVLRTARSEEFRTEKGFEKALNVLNIFNIDGLVVIGGDGSFNGAMRLAEAGIPTVGIPGTIDNDLAYTDYTLGYYTAIDTVIDAISKIRDTSSSHGRANIIEVMGRHCGDIALYAGLAGGAESIIVPEIGVDPDDICQRLLNGRNRGKLHSIIILAEGAGSAIELGSIIENRTGIETKATILGHIQRGGSPSAFDRILASRLGHKAVELLEQDGANHAIGLKNNKIIAMPFAEALAMKKEIDIEIYELAKILSI